MGNRLMTDVVVVGAGYAGLSAALEARHHGAEVILICDRGPMANDSAKGGGMWALAGTPLQEKMGIKDSPELFTQDLMAANKSGRDAELIRTATHAGRELYDWLTGLGANFHRITPQAGHSVPRAHEEVGGTDKVDGRGGRVIKLMHEAAKAQGVDVRMRMPTTNLLTDEKGAAIGIRARDERSGEVTIEARRGVVLAAGGFAKNKDMLKKYAPGLLGMPSVSAGGSTGDGIRIGMEAGAAAINLDTAVMGCMACAPGAKRINMNPRLYTRLAEEGIAVNKEGHRFMNEITAPYRAAAGIMRQTDKIAFMVFDEETRNKAELGGEESLPAAATPEELGAKLNIDERALAETITSYNKAVPQVDAYGSPIQKRPLRGPLFAIPFTGSVIMTHGGLKINTQAQVFHQAGHIIPRLYAAGDNAAGLGGPSEGYYACPSYLTGCAYMTAVCFGRIAGRSAAQG